MASIANESSSGQAEAKAQVRREFLIERQGRTFVLYAGLLDLAHAQGLRSIKTQIIQIPNEDNGQMAIVAAQVETDRGEYHGLGDAGPTNVSRMMLTCTIRLAETRAKARALRDAVNVGVVAFEELGEDDGVHALPSPSADSLTQPVGAASLNDRGTSSASVVSALATPAQVNAIYAIGRSQAMSEDDVDARSELFFNARPQELTRKQASDLITSLKGSGR